MTLKLGGAALRYLYDLYEARQSLDIVMKTPGVSAYMPAREAISFDMLVLVSDLIASPNPQS